MWKHRAVNGWPLFWLLAVPMNVFMAGAMARFDLASAEGVSQMIQYSVRWAVPFIYLVVAASAVPALYPCDFTRWWGRNRRHLGLLFAVAMAWQGAFIFIMSNLHSGYYYAEVYYLRDELEGSSGYIFLAAMVATSFRPGRRHLTATQWKVLHRSGVYFLWAYPFSVYWWNVSYYPDPKPIDHVFYWVGFLAFAARIAAWGRRRSGSTQPWGSHAAQPVFRAAGLVLIAAGIIAAATGRLWQDTISSLLLAPQWSATLELWLPFWPFEPFLPLALIGLGAWLQTGSLAAALGNLPATPRA